MFMMFQVVSRWKSSYAPADSSNTMAQLNKDQKKSVCSLHFFCGLILNKFQTKSKWEAPAKSSSKTKYPIDHIESYLSESLMSSDAIAAAGGYMSYWHNAAKMRPSVAHMAMDFVSAPGTVAFVLIKLSNHVYSHFCGC